jgi:hypothetical protein
MNVFIGFYLPGTCKNVFLTFEMLGGVPMINGSSSAL